MIARLVVTGVLVFSAAACFAPPPALETPRAPVVDAKTTVRIGTSRGVVSVPIEDYVLGSILAEVGPVGEAGAPVTTGPV